MRAAEYGSATKFKRSARAKPRGWCALKKPKASALKLHHPDMAKSKSKAKSKAKTPKQRRSRVLGLPISNGASPVASVLGIRSGATPRGRIHITMSPLADPSEQDISTLLGIGHFYFALTRVRC